MTLTTRPKTGRTLLQYQAMDRAYCLSRMIDDFLDEHEAFQFDPVATELVERLQEASWALYQHLGGEKIL